MHTTSSTTTVEEIADGIHRISTFVPDASMTFNQFLVRAEEPLLFHCGTRALFPQVADAVRRVIALDELRWIGFGHVEADECGAMNDWLAAAPNAQVAFGRMGCMVSVNDMADRPPHMLDDGDVIDLGGRKVRHVATPHVPHGWDAGVLFEEATSTLMCGDLFTCLGPVDALSPDSPMNATETAEDLFGYSTLTPGTVATVERLAELAPATLALMHGAAHSGDGAGWLQELAASYATRLGAS